ncbi:N-acetylmuramoyl-L-alanine amidase [Oceanobacillus halophilus]|uniref:N-acetylmuramoyl-L-alanine amidase n=1 Tax=Oceanobacillus halophilus TaxID=930130 RepID=A0A495A250_9BACI|nr:N-acetylmuramoyl-L-alanine amidase [Oceanobacillus halophilus]RKQ33456.1 N-acetylmuramoyl-L-alanine amidase [Oceanobacillus halophilus]
MKPKHHLVVLGLIIIFLFIPMMVHAESGQTYEVNAAILNVRSEPAQNSEIIGRLTTGNQVTVFQEKYGWMQTYFGGQEAWIAKQHLIPLTKQPSATSVASSEVENDTITVIADGVHIRSGAGTNFSVIASASNGDTYPLVQTDGDWHQITLSNGKHGWIASWLTDTNQADAVESNSTDTNETMDESDFIFQGFSDGSGPLSGYKIVVDPGHGGNDPGAIGLGGIFEKDLILSTAKQVVQHLRNAGATVIITRSGDYYVSLEERSQISNSFNTDAFVSIHFNAFPILKTQGISTYYLSPNGKQLANSIQSQLFNTVNLENRGIRQEDYFVLRSTEAPAVLMELGFITNPYDLNVIQTTDYRDKVGQAITNGLIEFFE